MAIELPQFRELSDESRRGGGTDPGYAQQQLHQSVPAIVSINQLKDLTIDAADVLLEERQCLNDVLLHGDEFYQPRFGVERNPNLPLIRELRKAGVEVFVCGQALNYKGFPVSAVAKEVPIADAALTVTVNRQLDGYGNLPVP